MNHEYPANRDYDRIEKAISFIRSNVTFQPTLEDIASHVGLSPFHFQRLFRRWAGVSPKRFLEYLTVTRAKELLDSSDSILDVSHSLGLSGAGRLHDQFVSIEAISPGEYKALGSGVQIYYGIHPGPFGNMLLAQTSRGLCALSFVDTASLQHEIDALCRHWPNANIIEDSVRTAQTANKIFNGPLDDNDKIHLMVRGTNFQINVWKALLTIPPGHIRSYQQLADQLQITRASRAVANAMAANPVAFLIPCHRVLRNNGELGGYRWKMERKQVMLAWEAMKYDTNDKVSDRKARGKCLTKQAR